jgi:hypothetical protein
VTAGRRQNHAHIPSSPASQTAPVADVLQHQRADEGYGGRDVPGKPGGSAVQGANLPFRYTPY